MYKLTLILKYMRRKLGPMFAAAAVMVCTAMVITVISVMGGFLTMLQDSAQQLTGDVSVMSRSMTGFAHYEDLLARLDALPEVDAVTPVVSMFGMINLNGQTVGVNIMGIEPETFSRIVRYENTLYWSKEDIAKQYGVVLGENPQEDAIMDVHAMGMSLKPYATDMPAAVIGIEVNPWQYRNEQGQYNIGNAAVGELATITVLPLTERGAPAEIGPVYQKLVVVNEFKSGLYDIDKSQVFVRFDVLQKILGMDSHEVQAFDPETGEPLPEKSIRPGRASELVLKGADGYTLEQVQSAVEREVSLFGEEHPDVVTPAVRSWRQRHAQFINAVKNEKGMVTFLFVIISIVAVFMVGATFYMTVLEKTRDIGVLRAVGASQVGIIGMYLGYGLMVGTVGALAGLVVAVALVLRLNDVQFWLANYLGVTSHFAWCAAGLGMFGLVAGGIIGFRRRKFVRLALLYGVILGAIGLVIAWVILMIFADLGPHLNDLIVFKMWDPQTYYFDKIPGRVDPVEAITIVIGAILSSVIGALIPAIIAAELDPVETLRHE